MKTKMIFVAILAAIFGVGGLSTSVSATGNNSVFNLQESEENVELRMGQNLLLAGNNLNNDNETKGLLFSAGNSLQLKTKSEYSFVAGNMIDYSAETEKDLFIAGNIITISKDAKIGRDVFATGNIITINASLPGNLAVASSEVVFQDDIKIKGNVEITADTIKFIGKVNIDGKLVVDSDTDIIGLENATYSEIERFESAKVELTAADIFSYKLFSIAALFVAFMLVMAMFPGVKQRVAKEIKLVQFGKDLLIGVMVLIFVPIIVVFLFITLVGAPLALILAAVYIIAIYLAQGYSGLWLGKLIVEHLAHGKLNAFLEMLIGITLLSLLAMIPLVGGYIGLVSLLLGLGLFMQSIKPNRKKDSTSTDEVEVEEAEVVETISATKEPKSTKNAQSSKAPKGKPVKESEKDAEEKED